MANSGRVSFLVMADEPTDEVLVEEPSTESDSAELVRAAAQRQLRSLLDGTEELY